MLRHCCFKAIHYCLNNASSWSEFRLRSPTKVGIPTLLFCPKNPSPGQRQRSVSGPVLAGPLTECFFHHSHVGTGLLHSILARAQDCSTSPRKLCQRSAVQHCASRVAARVARKNYVSASLYSDARGGPGPWTGNCRPGGFCRWPAGRRSGRSDSPRSTSKSLSEPATLLRLST